MVNFYPEERLEYGRIQSQCKDAFNLAVSGHSMKEAYQNILEILLRLRLFCNNGITYWSHEEGSEKCVQNPTEALRMLQQNEEAICRMCSCDIASIQGTVGQADVLITPCLLAICADCIPTWKKQVLQHIDCKPCNTNTLSGTAAQDHKLDLVLTRYRYPSKIVKL